MLAVLPFFHIYGMTVLLNAALHARARLVIMPSFDLGDFLGNIQNHKCTIAFIAPPPVAVALAKHPPLIDDYDLSSLNVVMSGAAPPGRRPRSRRRRAAGLPRRAGLRHERAEPGQPHHPVRRRPAQHEGRGAAQFRRWTVSNAASKIVDSETGDEINPPAEGLSETGELWFKGPNVMAGYLNNEKATKETIDDDGWLHTGDLAQVDADGCVYIVDRLKELIKYKATRSRQPNSRRCC